MTMQAAKPFSAAVTIATAVLSVILYKQGLWWWSAWAFTVMLVSAFLVGMLSVERERTNDHKQQMPARPHYTIHHVRSKPRVYR